MLLKLCIKQVGWGQTFHHEDITMLRLPFHQLVSYEILEFNFPAQKFVNKVTLNIHFSYLLLQPGRRKQEMFAIVCPKSYILLFFEELRNNFRKLRKTMNREKMKLIFDEVKV